MVQANTINKTEFSYEINLKHKVKIQLFMNLVLYLKVKWE